MGQRKNRGIDSWASYIESHGFHPTFHVFPRVEARASDLIQGACGILWRRTRVSVQQEALEGN